MSLAGRDINVVLTVVLKPEMQMGQVDFCLQGWIRGGGSSAVLRWPE